jgi:hypothetical protein
MIRIRKMPPTETPEFPRRWVASREPDGDGVAWPVLGYFTSQQEAITQTEFPARIVSLTR